MLNFKKYKKELFIALIITLLTACGGGGSNTSTTISGVAVDGYLQNSTVTLNGVSTTTDENGKWSITYTKSNSDEDIVFVSGGIDTATNEEYEGSMSSPIDSNSTETVVITPLTSLITSLVNSGSSKAEATKTIATSLDLSEEALTSDPISLLKTGDSTQKEYASKAIKKALILQKLSEVVGNASSSEDSLKDSVMSSVIDAVAVKLKNASSDFDTVINDVDSILDDVSSQISNSDISEKLSAVSESALYIVQMIDELDETELFLTESEDVDSIIEKKEKAIEIASLSIEQRVKDIAISTNETQSETAKENAKKITKAITMFGGINGLSEKINDDTDISDYSDSITDTLVDSLSENYDILEEAGLDEETILSAVNSGETELSTILSNNSIIISVDISILESALEETQMAINNEDETTETSETSEYTELYSDSVFEATDWTEYTHSKKADPNYDEVFEDTKVKRFDIVVTSERWQSMLDNMTEMYGEFGASIVTNINNGPTQTGPINTNFAAPQTSLVSTDTTLLDTDEDPIFVPAEIYYDSKQWYKVGVRFKGNSSLQTAWESGILKLSFKLDFDEFEDQYPQIDNQRFYGFKKFSLKNNYDDKSFLREKVAADVFKDAGVVVSHTAFYELYVDHGDGPEYFGLYTLVEEVDGEVLDTQFSDDDGNLYKPEDGSANFVEGTFLEEDFVKKTNDDEDEADWSDIESLFSALHDSSRLTNPSLWRDNLEDVFDVDSFLKYLAVNGVIQNWDTYGRMAHNYYLYNNPENGKLTWIPWDNNEALQDGKMGGALSLDFSNIENDAWPLIEKIYADTTYKAKYDTYVDDVIKNAFESTSMQEKYDTYSELIEDSVDKEIDGYTFLTSTNDFDTAINELKNHVVNRKTAAEDYLK